MVIVELSRDETRSVGVIGDREATYVPANISDFYFLLSIFLRLLYLYIVLGINSFFFYLDIKVQQKIILYSIKLGLKNSSSIFSIKIML